jgi:hypothetical protein
MSLFGQTLILYLVIGIGVAGAVLLAERQAGRLGVFPIAAAVPFWPLYLPLLLTPRPTPAIATTVLPGDALAAAIAYVEAELDAALGSLDGWAEGVLVDEKLRIGELRTAWSSQAQRIRDMDRILALPECRPETTPLPVDTRLAGSRQARQENIERLRRLRRRAFDDLDASLTWVRELVSRIHLAKFNGSGAKGMQELVAQIAAAVDGLSALSELEEEMPSEPDAQSRTRTASLS